MLKVKQYRPLPHLISPCSLKANKFLVSMMKIQKICLVKKKTLLLQIQIQQKINKKKTIIQKRFRYSPPKDDIGW